MYSLLSVRLGKMKDLFCSPVKGVLIDISGVLKDGNKAIPGSIEAFKRLQDSKFPFRLVTNETQTTVKGLVKKLHNLGFNVNEKDIFAPIPAVIKIVKNENLHPFLLLHPDALEDFSDIDKNHPNCVILGDADYCFTYDAMNNAFRALMQMEKPILISLGKGMTAASSGKVQQFCTSLNNFENCRLTKLKTLHAYLNDALLSRLTKRKDKLILFLLYLFLM
ncbi:phospholysine phosphohistidine inorganic pyrophosphate phosphatase-like isoform X8 [Lycorma delicatula]|uniref:phospholysine phosphohistidine inorganic pyrophosphate phosphatase-like isoform X8 n=1 Tax=Lycorma delicatula TaxID=130591 RepID=UPI003F517B8F